MKLTLAAFALLVSATAAPAQFGLGMGTGSNPRDHYVHPYTTQRGTLVPEHFQTNPNGTTRDNYGTRDNFNPHTGETGTRSPSNPNYR